MNRILTIIGPTASGKTEFSVRIAKEIDAEIIGLDSRQIYKDLIVGTAQPTKLEQSGIPHHLINILPLSETVSAGSYSTLVKKAVLAINSRYKKPLICGGAGLYYRALAKGIFSGSRTDNDIRKRLEKEYDKKGPQEMLSKLIKYDPDYAQSIHFNNKKRLVRALEILESTGKSPTKNFKDQKQTVNPNLKLYTVYLNWDRLILKDRIAKRTNQMLKKGWIDEVRQIINKYPSQTLHPLDSIGYREIILYLKGELTLELLEKTIIIKTRQFAKRQIQWFKNENIDLTIDMNQFNINNLDEILNKIRKNRNFFQTRSDYSIDKPEIKIIINKKKASDLGVPIQSIGKTLETLYGGKTVTKFNKLGKEYPIILQQYVSNRKNSESLSKIFVRSETTGKLISLANLVEFKEVGSAQILSRYNRQRAITISSMLAENYTLTEAIAFLEKTVDESYPQIQLAWKGKSEEIKETSNELFIIFALALLTAYLVMAATFNSFVHPFIIILTVPLAVFGGIVFLLFLNSSINIFSQIALIILIGISTKNSILIVDWANQLRTQGKNIIDAVKEACSLRFRAIIMTSLSTMIAMVPLVIGNIGPGAGEGSRLAVGSTILGGMIISTFFTLYVTPTMYVALAKNTKRIDAVDIELKKQLR